MTILYREAMTRSQKKRRIHAYIAAYYSAHGVAPTMREIGLEVGLSPSTVHKYVQELTGEGLLTAANARPRSIVPVCNVKSDSSDEAEPTCRIRIDLSDGGSLYFDYRGKQPLGSIPLNICGVFDGSRLKKRVGEIVGVHVVSPDE